jgi:hypothetical protein
MKATRRMLALVVLCCVGSACSDDPTGTPRGGPLLLQLSTPNADDGAVMFEITGPPIDSVTTINDSMRLFTRREGGTLLGVVIGTVGNGPIVNVWVPDVNAATSYSGRVVDVADRQNALRTSLESYTVRVTP